MEITLSSRQMSELIHGVAVVVVEKLKKELAKEQLPEMVTTAEAAKILGISAGRMRQIADKYPHVKRGENKQGQLLFMRNALLQ